MHCAMANPVVMQKCNSVIVQGWVYLVVTRTMTDVLVQTQESRAADNVIALARLRVGLDGQVSVFARKIKARIALAKLE